MVKAHATSHGPYATVLTSMKQPMFESDLGMNAQASTLIGLAFCYAKQLLLIIIIKCLYWLSNQSIKSKIIAPIARNFLATSNARRISRCKLTRILGGI